MGEREAFRPEDLLSGKMPSGNTVWRNKLLVLLEGNPVSEKKIDWVNKILHAEAVSITGPDRQGGVDTSLVGYGINA